MSTRLLLERVAPTVALSLVAALKLHHGATGEHIERTRSLAERVVPELGLGRDAARATRYAALLHDIGKMYVPDRILDKASGLSEAEWMVVKRHPEAGASRGSGVSGLERVSSAVLAHHERFDGRGYPAGLVGKEIPIEARIVSVVDAYDAMTSDRPYRQAMSHEKAVEQLNLGAGLRFDPTVVEAANAVLT